MKKTRARSIIIYFLIGSFFLGLGFFLVQFTVRAKNWAINPINGHLSGDELANAGKILDRNDTILAQSKDSKRIYNDDTAIRRAMLHITGDGSINIETSIQNVFTDKLFGYNIITGLSAPEFLKTTNDMKLTLDSETCKIACDKLGNRKGAVAVYNYKTGEVLCLVSKPNYDPYDIPSPSEIDNNSNYEGAYLNRAISSSFTPGSVFKVITSAAAIESIDDLDSKEFHCPGSITVNGEKIICMEHHGTINFKDAMAKSCNVAFAELAMEIGKDKMTEQAENMGFNNPFKIDSIPVKRSTYDVTNATEADLGWSGIGQQKDLLNPLHIMKIMGGIANDGTPVSPYMIKYISSSFGLKSHTGHAEESDRMMSSDVANKLKDVMRYTVKTQYGDSMFSGLTVCAKTGTAEVGTGKPPHAWIAGFSTDANCPLAFAIVVENSGYGYKEAGPIATAVLKNISSNIYNR